MQAVSADSPDDERPLQTRGDESSVFRYVEERSDGVRRGLSAPQDQWDCQPASRRTAPSTHLFMLHNHVFNLVFNVVDSGKPLDSKNSLTQHHKLKKILLICAIVQNKYCLESLIIHIWEGSWVCKNRDNLRVSFKEGEILMFFASSKPNQEKIKELEKAKVSLDTDL